MPYFEDVRKFRTVSMTVISKIMKKIPNKIVNMFLISKPTKLHMPNSNDLLITKWAGVA